MHARRVRSKLFGIFCLIKIKGKLLFRKAKSFFNLGGLSLTKVWKISKLWLLENQNSQRKLQSGSNGFRKDFAGVVKPGEEQVTIISQHFMTRGLVFKRDFQHGGVRQDSVLHDWILQQSTSKNISRVRFCKISVKTGFDSQGQRIQISILQRRAVHLNGNCNWHQVPPHSFNPPLFWDCDKFDIAMINIVKYYCKTMNYELWLVRLVGISKTRAHTKRCKYKYKKILKNKTWVVGCVEGWVTLSSVSAEGIWLIHPRNQKQKYKHRKNCECCPGHYLSTSVY